ncbi:MAG: hypothetical protein M3362_06290 [Acidobacteriota bacterium]|nr:hypothetical protein [Acidobacteriota bacterium]
MHSVLKSRLFIPVSLMLGLVFFATERAQAQTTFGSCSSANAPDTISQEGVSAVGQSITVPAGNPLLKSFTFNVASGSVLPFSFRFYVYPWRGAVANGMVVEGLQTQGGALFRSDPVTVSSTDYHEVTIDTSNLPLTPGARYIIIASNIETYSTNPRYSSLNIKVCDASTSTYDGGFLAFYILPSSSSLIFDDWSSGSWVVNSPVVGNDLSFSASFTSIQQITDNLQNQINTVTGEKQTLQNQVNDLTGQVHSLQTQVNTLTAQVQTLTAQKQTLQNQLNNANQTIGNLNAQVTQLQALLSQPQSVINAFVNLVEADLRRAFNNPRFSIPGATPQQRLQNLINALLNLNKGRKEGIYQGLGGKQ